MDEINSIVLRGIRIDEPIVTITDLLVSVLCFIYAYKIHKSGKKEKTFLYFKIYFFVMGIATMLGGLIGHAFLYAFNFYWKLPGWITSMISIMFVERAAIEHTRIWLKDSLVKIFGIINIIEFLTFLTLTVVTLNFFYVEFHSGYGLMFVVLSLEGFLFLKTKNIATKYLLAGVAFAALAAIFFMNKISPHQWFNYLSVSHVLMAVAATFFYQGAKRIDMSSAKNS
ncbi:hypothetical protein GM418_26430 [Maribellus comscasis]|uniref:Uncharacterized protein n=1 Tax=Maribellus comscasis TaxID=2681766 RepID=A0A6I6K0F5_9BACT|nr:hypothetical protein [Maribellus comscasis]QGY47069.1 hypothetical protein GM418_26430 [Maribellus comscasis]